jgi:Leucine-rich repeat (LRR) protein
LKNLTKLKDLDLSNNKLESIDSYVFSQLELNYLNLSNNSLNVISQSAFKESGIKKLVLSDNLNLNITELRKALYNIRFIDSLDISSTNANDNDFLSEPFKEQAQNLKSLNISGNLLTSLPKMPNFRMIQELDFSNNQIKSLNQVQAIIPEFFDKLQTKQTYVYLHGNPFR